MNSMLSTSIGKAVALLPLFGGGVARPSAAAASSPVSNERPETTLAVRRWRSARCSRTIGRSPPPPPPTGAVGVTVFIEEVAAAAPAGVAARPPPPLFVLPASPRVTERRKALRSAVTPPPPPPLLLLCTLDALPLRGIVIFEPLKPTN